MATQRRYRSAIVREAATTTDGHAGGPSLAGVRVAMLEVGVAGTPVASAPSQ